jgi:mannose-6-phosphate isomerase-like protein (cupin superfamily)
MKIIKEQDVYGDHIEAPNKRVVKHLAAPWTLDTKNLWVGTSTVEPGNETNAHSHDHNEEVFYCVSGTGIMIVDGEEQEYTPGTVVFSPPGTVHQVVNTGAVPLKSVCSVSPPFEQEQFRSDHDMK